MNSSDNSDTYIEKEISSNSFIFGLFVNYLKPSMYVNSITNIDLDSLKNQGIKLIICDLDNTLVPHFTKFPTKNAIDFVEKVKEMEFHFVLISNNTSKRVSFFAEKLGLKDYISNAKKPMPFNIKKVITNYKVKPNETVIIGDIIVMDILAANILHTESILVKPLLDSDYILNKILIWLEKKLFLKLEKGNLIIKNKINKNIIYGDEYEIL